MTTRQMDGKVMRPYPVGKNPLKLTRDIRLTHHITIHYKHTLYTVHAHTHTHTHMLPHTHTHTHTHIHTHKNLLIEEVCSTGVLQDKLEDIPGDRVLQSIEHNQLKEVVGGAWLPRQYDSHDCI